MSARRRVVIVDDEPLARQVLRELVSAEHDLVVAAECRDGHEALLAVAALEPAVVFLDVRMPELDGVELIKRISGMTLEARPALVFVTAYDEFAVRAFDADAIDYLVKPFTDERFRATVARLRRLWSRESQSENVRAVADVEVDSSRIVVTVGDRSVIVPIAAIDWVSADGYYSRLHVGETTYLIRSSLATLERRFGSHRFVRAHRGALVQIDRVRELRRRGGRYELVLITGARVPVSERRRATVIRTIGA